MRIHAVLRRALTQAVKWGWLTTNPAAAASPPRARRKPMALPDASDVLRLIDAAAEVNPALPLFLRLAAATGARRGELCALRWTDVDLDAGRLTISRGLVETRHGAIEKDTKTHAERRVALDAGTVGALEAHQHRVSRAVSACGAKLA